MVASTWGSTLKKKAEDSHLSTLKDGVMSTTILREMGAGRGRKKAQPHKGKKLGCDRCVLLPE